MGLCTTIDDCQCLSNRDRPVKDVVNVLQILLGFFFSFLTFLLEMVVKFCLGFLILQDMVNIFFLEK